MSRPQKENLFLGNGATSKEAGAVALDYRGPVDKKNVNLRLPQFVDQFNHLPKRLLDLLEIAAYVFAADRLRHRGPKDAVVYNSWSRKMHFIVKVRDYTFWKQDKVKKALSEALEFMTGDAQYTFEFQPGHSTPPTSLFDSEQFSVKADKPTSVLLFSGGLDSLSGAVEQLEKTDNDLFLVSHCSGSPNIKKYQRLLYERLRQNYPGRVRRYAFECGLHGGRAPEETQRTRAFLFCSIAFAVASLAGLNRCYAYENGVTSLNFARREDARKGRSSRTTHPKTHALMKRFLMLVGDQDFEIKNPFWNQSKTDVISKLGQSRSKDLISTAISCSTTINTLGSATHCGCCFQCIDRRLSAYAADMQEFDDVGIYSLDVVTKTIPGHEKKTAVLDYVRQALGFENSSLDSFCDGRWVELADVTEFVEMSEEAAVDAIWELCQQHGHQIADGIVALRNQHDDLRNIPETDSLLDLLAQRAHLKPDEPVVADMSNREVVEKLSSQISGLEKSVGPHAQRGSKTVASASAGGKKRAEEYAPKYDEARKFMRKFNTDNPFISFTEARKKAAKEVGVSPGALRNHIKKSDFPAWKTS